MKLVAPARSPMQVEQQRGATDALGGITRGSRRTSGAAPKIGFLPTLVESTTFPLESNNSEGRFEQYSARAIQRAHQKLQKIKCRKVDHLTPPHANFSRPKP